jgi:hypothetical protein
LEKIPKIICPDIITNLPSALFSCEAETGVLGDVYFEHIDEIY